eukprot:3335821-Lingulodinium_polyedra.AAC.1
MGGYRLHRGRLDVARRPWPGRCCWGRRGYQQHRNQRAWRKSRPFNVPTVGAHGRRVVAAR